MSTSLRLCGVSFCYDDARPLLDGVDLHLTPGWTGLVGANGAGKTTLLRLLAGELRGQGSVVVEPEGGVVLRLEQRLDAPSRTVRAFAASWDKRALRLHARLGLAEDGVARWSQLSPGERRRWQVAAVRWADPDVWLLDEPGNHLDAAAREALVASLRGFRGVGVLVSHDRALLDAVTVRTARLHRGRIDVVEAPWSQAEAVWHADAAARLDHLQRARREDRRARRQLVAARQRADQAGRSRSLRGVDRHDHDARSTARKAAAAKAEAAHLRALGRAQGVAERASDRLAGAERPEDIGRDLRVPFTPSRKAVVTRAHGSLAVGGRRLVSRLDLTVGRTDRVWVAGPNGAGKSTLLRRLVAERAVPDERLLDLPQELDEAAIAALVERLASLPPTRRGVVLGLVAAFGVPPKQLVASARPSPGEARKLALALGLGDDRALLVLDEPTHHLDLPSRVRLQAALEAYPGALVLVTHDEALGHAVADTRWILDGIGGLEVVSSP